ncbi:MAG: hypothetical protein AB8B86_14265 [Pseudomonadales bacterium]
MTRKFLTVLLLLFFASSTFARTDKIGDVKPLRVLIADDNRWGGCMVLLDKSISATGLDCPSSWVSFSCTGDFNSQQVAGNMLDSAKMALALDIRLWLQITDEEKHNGACVAKRVDVYR